MTDGCRDFNISVMGNGSGWSCGESKHGLVGVSKSRAVAVDLCSWSAAVRSLHNLQTAALSEYLQAPPELRYVKIVLVRVH
jgi:hypothetical protein